MLGSKSSFERPNTPKWSSESRVSEFLSELVFRLQVLTVVELGCFIGWTYEEQPRCPLPASWEPFKQGFLIQHSPKALLRGDSLPAGPAILTPRITPSQFRNGSLKRHHEVITPSFRSSRMIKFFRPKLLRTIRHSDFFIG